MSKNASKDLRAVTPIAEYESQIEELVKRNNDLLSVISAPDRAKAALAATKQRWVDLKAEAMAEGRTPDTAKAEAEIAAAVQAETDAIENAKAAKAARERIQTSILELQDKISAAERDLRIAGLEGFADRNAKLEQAEADANRRAQEAEAEAMDARMARRQNAIDYVIGKAECGIRTSEGLLSLLGQRITSLSAVPRQGNELRAIVADGGDPNRARAPIPDGQYYDIPVVKMHELELEDDLDEVLGRADRVAESGPGGLDEIPVLKVRDLRNKTAEPGEPNALNDILRRMELALKPAAPFAEIAAEVFDNDKAKREMLGILRRIATQVRQACKECNVTVPEWAFAGDSSWRTWIGEAERESIRKFLRNAGIEC